ncbi:MAG TPA: hypothetical protein VF525_09570 [Pyrinomonadaceae bacterium]|jgi:hypothetical protein
MPETNPVAPRPGESTDLPTDVPPTQPHDPVAPDPAQPEPLPLPPDRAPAHAPVREPETPMPAGDPRPTEPTHLV